MMLPAFAGLGGCEAVLLHPAGDVAVQQRDLIIASTGLMLLIVVPVLAFTVIFAWRYRATNTAAIYEPDWHHSTQLEVLIWTAPLLIIIALGALTWISAHLLDPYRAIERMGPDKLVASDAKPITVEVVALDWKWLFFYPDLGIATVNELAAPLDVPIDFKITSGTVMNSFFVPALAGQIYAMAGMETKLHAVINKPGVYDGFSANYSGAGFSHMTFKFHGLTKADFDTWVAGVRAKGATLDAATYATLEKPSEETPVTYYAHTSPDLYDKILNMCVAPGSLCMSTMMQIDAKGGGTVGEGAPTQHDRRDGGEASGATFPASGRPAHSNVQPSGMTPTPLSPQVDGAGHESGPAMHDMPGMSDMPGMHAPSPTQLNR